MGQKRAEAPWKEEEEKKKCVGGYNGPERTELWPGFLLAGQDALSVTSATNACMWV